MFWVPIVLSLKVLTPIAVLFVPVVLENKVDLLSNQLRKSDSALAAAVSKITLLQELGKIK